MEMGVHHNYFSICYIWVLNPLRLAINTYDSLPEISLIIVLAHSEIQHVALLSAPRKVEENIDEVDDGCLKDFQNFISNLENRQLSLSPVGYSIFTEHK